MWLRRPLDDILSSPARVAVLRTVLCGNAPLSGREIHRRLGIGYTPTRRALKALVASGVLSKQNHRRATTRTVRRLDVPLLSTLRQLYEEEDRRTWSFALELAERLPLARCVILYGSEARRSAKSGSDTDWLVVVEARDAGVEHLVASALLDLAEASNFLNARGSLCSWNTPTSPPRTTSP